MKWFNFFKQELAIDLGTANTLIMQNDVIVIDEPSIVAINRKTGETIAVGSRAMQMHEKTHENIKTIRPLKDGVIADFQAAEKLIEGLINMIGTKRNFFSHLKMVICIPSGITEVEKRAVFDSADHVDSKETYLIHEPMAAALGIGLDVEEPVGHIIIDIGGGTTEIAVIAMSGIVTDQSIRTAGDEFNYDIMEYMKRAHNILIGERTAEQLKINVGSALKQLESPPD
ncbi:MAG: rod shape-determining protein MreB, partial [Saprospiraceae bacterium]